MTPAARLSAAIEVLDLYLSGTPAEKALTNWARRSRFAGSKDRAAIRDIVFDCLRRRESLIARGGARTGRALVAAHQFETFGMEETLALFTGEGHAPPVLSPSEQQALARKVSLGRAVELDLPEWLVDRFEAGLGARAAEVAHTLKTRAPVFLRVNKRRATREQAAAALATEGIVTSPHAAVPTALLVTENPRKIAGSVAYADGLVELQDASSQAICAALPEATRMLDYCAGGGGKVLAYGAAHDAALFAHDANPARLRDLPDRADRAGLSVRLLDASGSKKAAPFDLVLVDVPCSGSGAWRRAPEGKWVLTPERLNALCDTQAQILAMAAPLVSPGGCLAYVTCSVLSEENAAQVDGFLARAPQFSQTYQMQYIPGMDGDGFFVAHLTRH